MAYEHSTISGHKQGGNGPKQLLLSATEIATLNSMGEALEDVEAGSVEDGTITDAKLATAVKVGNVASLTTTYKTNVVGAVNELDAELGVLSSLATTNKATHVDAINECVTNIAAKASKTGAETLTNKSLTSPHLTTPLIEDGDTGITVTSADQTHATPIATIPDIGDAADEFVMKDVTQTLTGKTLTSPVLTTPKIATTGSINDAGGDEYLKFVEATTPVTYIQIASGDTGVAPKVQGAGETNTDLHLLGSGTGNVKISDGTDPTKLAIFELNGASTGKATTIAISHTNDRTITLPDATDTLVGRDTTDVLTNKTLETSCKFADATDNTKDLIVALNGATADKTMTIVSSQSDDRTITIPDATGTIALENRNQTLTIGAHDYAAGSEDWTLNAAELLLYVHKPTNANAPVNAIVSTAIKEYMFINTTGQALTVKTAAGTGVQIASTKVAKVFCDGVNVIRITADA